MKKFVSLYLFLGGISCLKIHLYLLKLVLYFSHDLIISSKFEAADEIMAKVQYQFREVRMDFKSRN